MALTPKQQRFVSEYAVDLNATGAAIRAGYSPKTAQQQGYQLLQHPSVSEAIAKKTTQTAVKLERTAEDISRFHWSVIENVDAPLSDRLKASSLEMRRFTEYSDKHEHTGDLTMRVQALQAVASMSHEQLRELAENARA